MTGSLNVSKRSSPLRMTTTQRFYSSVSKEEIRAKAAVGVCILHSEIALVTDYKLALYI
jgi:hypothetical protein